MNGTNNTQSTVSASSTLPGQTSGYTTRVTAKQAFGRAVQTASVSTSLTLPLKMQSTEKRFIAERSIAVVSGPQIRLLRPSVTPSSSSLSSPPASPPASSPASPPSEQPQSQTFLAPAQAPIQRRSSAPEAATGYRQNLFLRLDGKVDTLRSISLEQTPPPKRKRSFGIIAKNLLNTSALMALAPKGMRMSDHVVMGMDKVAGYENQGIPRENLEKTQKVANETETLVAYRPVELICRTLIEEGAESKGLNIKGKSSNWGPMAGFIPFDQAFSKLASIQNPHDRAITVAKYNEKNMQSVKDGHATVEHLSLSQRRMDELTELDILHDFNEVPPAEGYTKAVTLMSTPKGMPAEIFEAHMNSEGKWDIFTGTGDEREKLMVIPKTADFDLLFAFSPYDKVNLGGEDKLRSFHPELGILSNRNESLIDALNTEFDRGPGKNMVHHGDDTKNPVTDMSANIPATVFIPESQLSKMGVYNESPILIKTYDELMKLFRTMRDAGIKVESNPLWEEMKNVVKEPFNVKLAMFEDKARTPNTSRRSSSHI